MGMYNFATAITTSVGRTDISTDIGQAAHVFGSLIAAGRQHVEGRVNELTGQLADMAKTEFVQQLADAAVETAQRFSYTAEASTPDSMALTGDAVNRAAESLRGV